jgi:hypothetical protein
MMRRMKFHFALALIADLIAMSAVPFVLAIHIKCARDAPDGVAPHGEVWSPLEDEAWTPRPLPGSAARHDA